MVIVMVINVVTIMALLLLFLGVVLIFNSRFIVKNRFNSKNENLAVKIVKISGFAISIIAVTLIYYFK